MLSDVFFFSDTPALLIVMKNKGLTPHVALTWFTIMAQEGTSDFEWNNQLISQGLFL